MATPFPFQAAATLLAAQLNAITTLVTSTKTASHTLTIADVGTRVIMNSASATTITVNTSIFGASDVVEILNIGAGVCTVTAGTCTVGTSGTLALAQNAGGTLTFISASASVFIASAATGLAKLGQTVQSTISGQVVTTSTSYVTTTLNVTITPSSSSSKVLLFYSATSGITTGQGLHLTLFRGTVSGTNLAGADGFAVMNNIVASGTQQDGTQMIFIDSPATTSATTYTAGFKVTGGTGTANNGSATTGVMIAIEVLP